VVHRWFHLKPLFPLLSEDGQFYVLALSQNHVRCCSVRGIVSQTSRRRTCPPALPRRCGIMTRNASTSSTLRPRHSGRPPRGNGVPYFLGRGQRLTTARPKLWSFYGWSTRGCARCCGMSKRP
jgi:hypothetical protein